MSAFPLTKPINAEAAMAEIAKSVEAWPDPLPIIQHEDGEEYPLQALPASVQGVIREVQDFAQAPVALVAASVLSALSVAAQGLADVERSSGLRGPCSIFTLTIAESGERKSSVDNLVTAGIKSWEAAQFEAGQTLIKQHAAVLRIWEAKMDATLTAIKTEAKVGKSTHALETKLMDLELRKPAAPIVPRLLYQDTTHEALTASMAGAWPSAAILSPEAGILFGSHSMKKDNLTGGLSTLNVLWDGGDLRVDRKTGPSFRLHGARLTLGLAVQEDVVRTFFEQSKGLARGSGFAARFLIAWPTSTQGQRPFKEAPASWPALSQFSAKLKDMLDLTRIDGDKGGLCLRTMSLISAAKRAWIEFHDQVEIELRDGGDLADSKDSASKAADNAARLAALFALLEDPSADQIRVDHIVAGAAIMSWHLYEARRFLGEVAMPAEVLAAAKLDAWLLWRASTGGPIKTSEIMRFGPSPTRKRKALDTALEELDACHRIRAVKVGKSQVIEINPALLGGAHGTS